LTTVTAVLNILAGAALVLGLLLLMVFALQNF
jgi:hypothetical protein